jgi:hypothetical protein
MNHLGVRMKVWMLSLLGALLLCGAAWAADADADANVTVETTAPVTLEPGGDAKADVDATATVDTGDATVSVDTAPRSTHSLRDEYRQWNRSAGTATTRRSTRTSSGKRIDVNPDSTDDFDSVNDIEGAGKDIEDYINEDVANTDRDRYDNGSYIRGADRDEYRAQQRRIASSTGDRYADYPEYENDAVDADRIGDRMYDDYDRGADRYWSRSYGDERYYDSREGSPCHCCSKCGRSYGGYGKCGSSKCGGCSKCGLSKCGSCHKAAVTYTPCEKCTSKCNSCHKPAATCGKCGKCGKCNKCGDKCGGKCGLSHGTSRKCSKC